MFQMKKLLSLLFCLALMLSLLPAQASAVVDEPVTVTVFTTNDIHGVVANSESAVGLAQTAAIKASTPNSLLVDAGDATQGASFATVSQGEDVIRIMNAAGYDAMAAGNHEFDYGTERLLSNANEAEFPILSANVELNGKPLLTGSTVVKVGDISIGFIGLTTVSTATSTNPAKLTGVSFNDEIAAAKEQIAELAESTDAIIIISHMGDNEAAVDNTSADLLNALTDAELSEVAAVVDGHSHTVEQDTYTRNDLSVPVIQTGTQLTALGKIELNFDGDGVSASGSLLDYDAAMSYPLTNEGQTAAARVQSAIDAANAEQVEILNENLCTNQFPLWGGYIYWDYAESRIAETNYGDFVTDAFAASAGVFAEQNNINIPIIALENGGGISATLPMGQVTRGDVLNAFNHGNMVEVLEITPSKLYTALEAGLTMTGQDETGLLIREKVSGSFMQVSGLTYSYDPSAESGAKVKEISLDNGTVLDRTDDNTKLLLATNSYVGASLASIGAQKLGELGGEDQIVMEYILSQTANGTSLNYPNDKGRIQIVNDKSPASYTVAIPVLSSEDAETSIADVKVHLSIDGGAYTKYNTDKNGNISVELTAGAHTLYLKESEDNKPVYVNNYSGSGTVTTREGYYRLGFLADASKLEASVSEDENTEPSETENTEKSTDASVKPTKATSSNKVPKTGETSDAALLVLLAAFSACAVVVLVKRNSKAK